jgi:DNA recombination protein RmuC
MGVEMIVAIVVAVFAIALGFVFGRKTAEKSLASQHASLEQKVAEQSRAIDNYITEVRQLTSERDVQKANVENAMKQLAECREMAAVTQNKMAEVHEHDLKRQQEAFDKQLNQLRENSEEQLKLLKEQMVSQSELLKEQIRTTSETVFKERQEELGKRNVEQVSKIVDPLQQSLKMMREALNDSKEKHQEALHKLDATIQANMKNSADLGETAARLTRALTGEVKVQGNFGELKLRQLLEDLGLKDGEQFSSQVHLRDKSGKLLKDEEGRTLIPDFVLHFPNHRDVVVDSKMSFTAYERYVNTEEPDEQAKWLKEHIASVRAQVERLAKKDYSKFVKEGYNKLNFVIMYIHTEGALNLALMNDGRLWKEAYDKGVLILGPQTMYMNLRILEMMWTQVRQLNNQEDMIKAASQIIDRTQDFAIRFADVESKMRDTVNMMDKLKITTSENGLSIITAAKNLIKAGGRENKKKKSLINDGDSSVFLDGDDTLMLADDVTSHLAEE